MVAYSARITLRLPICSWLAVRTMADSGGGDGRTTLVFAGSRSRRGSPGAAPLRLRERRVAERFVKVRADRKISKANEIP
jgi:hypothetical protein